MLALAVAGLMAMDVTAGAVTVIGVELNTPPNAALMVALPKLTAVANPAVLIFTTVTREDFQTAEAVTFFELPSLYFAVAVNCCVFPRGSELLAGEMDRELTVSATPLPDKATVCVGAFSASSLTVTLPLNVPTTVGFMVTAILHVDLEAT